VRSAIAAAAGLLLVAAAGFWVSATPWGGGERPSRDPAAAGTDRPSAAGTPSRHQAAFRPPGDRTGAIAWAPGWRHRLRPPPSALADDLPDIYARGCQADAAQTVVTVCADGPRSGHTVLTIGDSHAASWHPALAALAVAGHWRYVSATKMACTVWDVPTVVVASRGRYTACDTWRRNAFALAERLRPAVVILHSAVPWSYMLDPRGRRITRLADAAQALTGAVRRSVTSARRSGAVVVVMPDGPSVRGSMRFCLRAAVAPTACDVPTTVDSRGRAVLLAAATAAGAVVADPYPVICPGRTCHVVQDDIVVFRDGGHLTRTYVLHRRGWVASWLGPLLADGP
jgi:hypothetical protein